MGLLFAESKSKGDFKTNAEVEFLREQGCKACSLNATPGKIDATGAKAPEIYILGEAAGLQEQEQRRQFVGKDGQLLKSLLPDAAFPLIRWNNVLNCHPPQNRDPTPQETACCRPRVEGDIIRTRPKVIWGFGNVPLKWVSGASMISNWRGRRMPVKIGDHTCWYYPFLHPSYLSREGRGRSTDDFASEDERITYLDIQRAWRDLDDLPEPIVHTEAMARANVEAITDIGEISKALQWASRQPTAGFDYETNCLRPYEGGSKILSVGVGTMERAFSFPIYHPGANYTPKQIAEVEELVRRFLMSAACRKAVHNLVFELEWSGYKFGEEVIRARRWDDTANAAAIVDERTGKKARGGPFSLEFLVQQYFGFNLKKISNVDRKHLESTPLHTVLQYNGMDAKYHEGLWQKLWAEIQREGLEVPYELANRRVPTVTLSQLRGVPVDQTVAKSLQKKYAGKVEAAKSTIFKLECVKRFERQKGVEFNPMSASKDLPYLLKDILKCDEIFVEDKYTKKRKVSTDESVLTEIIDGRQDGDEAKTFAKALIELREAQGTKSKYVDSLIMGEENCVIYPDGKIHTNFNTYYAETGRLSSDDPNLQNFPKRDAETKEVRKSVVAWVGSNAKQKKRKVILSFDYGQIEARVIAMFTKDKVFCKALWEKFDVHQEWAERLAYAYPSRVGGKALIKDKKVMKDFRTDVKNQWTFPLFFGARDQSVSNFLKIPVDIISEQVDEFWKMFPESRAWQKSLIKFYNEYGYVETLTGRRRHGPLSVNKIYNSPVQGTAAEIVLDAMCRLSETGDPELQPEINIHDDLTFVGVDIDRVDVVAEQVIDHMLKVPFKFINVPIAVEMSVGPNWCDMEEIKDDSGKTLSVYFSNEWE